MRRRPDGRKKLNLTGRNFRQGETRLAHLARRHSASYVVRAGICPAEQGFWLISGADGKSIRREARTCTATGIDESVACDSQSRCLPNASSGWDEPLSSSARPLQGCSDLPSMGCLSNLQLPFKIPSKFNLRESSKSK